MDIENVNAAAMQPAVLSPSTGTGQDKGKGKGEETTQTDSTTSDTGSSPLPLFFNDEAVYRPVLPWSMGEQQQQQNSSETTAATGKARKSKLFPLSDDSTPSLTAVLDELLTAQCEEQEQERVPLDSPPTPREPAGPQQDHQRIFPQLRQAPRFSSRKERLETPSYSFRVKSLSSAVPKGPKYA